MPGLLPGPRRLAGDPELTGTTLPEGQETGAYRDSAGALHVLTRRPGRIALFKGGAWGDPRFATTARPRMTLVSPVLAGHADEDGRCSCARASRSTAQARLAVTVVEPVGPPGHAAAASGSRIGDYLKGGPTNTLKTVQLRPGALPLRIRVRREVAQARACATGCGSRSPTRTSATRR